MGSPPGWTTQPCHGCGSIELHRKNAVCSACKGLLEEANKTQEYQARQIAEGSIVVRHSRVRHMISRPYLLGNSARWGASRINDELSDAWASLLMALLEPTGLRFDRDEDRDLITNKPSTWGTNSDGYWGAGDIWLVKPGVRDALNRFDLAIRLALQYTHLTAKAQGLALLAALNDGTVALSKYEDVAKEVEEAIKEVEKKNRETAKYHGPFARDDEEEEEDEEEPE